ncbi:hypothetical protein TNCV_4867501 [Trichonephila clavipes]|nr:hypothetical protein TNCV_4867501 [Trichonephila clavipes]
MTDHNPLVWLNRNVSSNPRLMRWALALQPYNFRIVHRSVAYKLPQLVFIVETRHFRNPYGSRPCSSSNSVLICSDFFGMGKASSNCLHKNIPNRFLRVKIILIWEFVLDTRDLLECHVQHHEDTRDRIMSQALECLMATRVGPPCEGSEKTQPRTLIGQIK